MTIPQSCFAHNKSLPRARRLLLLESRASMSTTDHTIIKRWGSLLIACTAIGLVWLVLLPLIALHPDVAAHIATQQRLGIDPSAMFYSEMEILPAVVHRVERLNQAHSAEFWRVSRADAPELKLTRSTEER